MKKQILSLLLSMIVGVVLFTSCKDDDNTVNVQTLPSTTYRDANLVLNYSGAPMLGKQATFIPDAQDPSKAILTLTGVETISQKNLSRSSSSSVIPGVDIFNISLNNLLLVDGKVAFEGTHQDDSFIVVYKGWATSSDMNISLDVVMSQNNLMGKTFKLAPAGVFSPSPFYINWKADSFPLVEDGTWDIQSAISMILSMTQIEGATIPSMLLGVLNEVTFLADGNIQATYKNEITDAKWKTSPLNLIMYRVESGKVKIYLNLPQIAVEAGADIQPVLEMIEGMIGKVNFAAGIPLGYDFVVTDAVETMNLYLDKDFLLPILEILKPLLEDETMVNAIVAMLKEQAPEDMAGLIDVFLKPVLIAFPNIVNTTTEVQLGLTFMPVTD